MAAATAPTPRATIIPNVTVWGTLVNIWNPAATPSPDINAFIEIALCGYGSQIPRVAGEAVFSGATSVQIQMQDGIPPESTAGEFKIVLYSNDLISPLGTYYTITVRNGNGDILQVNAYVFEGAGSYDLSLLTPYDPNQAPPPLPPLITNELLVVGPADNMVFPGDTYTSFQTTISGDITNPTTENMVPGNLYTFMIQQDGTGNYLFLWPPNVYNATLVSPVPGALTIQTFVCDAAGNLFAIAGGTYWP